MAKTTAFPCSIVAQMIARGQLSEPGVIHPVKIGWKKTLSDKFFEELKKRKIEINECVSKPFN